MNEGQVQSTQAASLGGAIVGQIDFEWPSQALFNQMPSDVELKSLKLKSNQNYSDPCLASVKVNLTHGFESAVIQKDVEKSYHD